MIKKIKENITIANFQILHENIKSDIKIELKNYLTWIDGQKLEE